MRNHADIRKWYYRILACIGMLIMLVLLYSQLKTYDSFSKSSDSVGYVDADTWDAASAAGTDLSVVERNGSEYHIVAEAMEVIYLYPGTYELTISARTEGDSWFQVLDVASNTELAWHEYTKGEEYHVVRFTTSVIYEDVVVRSYSCSGEQSENDDDSEESGSLTIYGYTMTSDGVVCNDAKWSILSVLFFILALWIGWQLLKRQHKSAFLFLIALSAAASLPFVSNRLPYAHDQRFHMSRIFSLAQAILQNQLPQYIFSNIGGNTIIPIMYPEILLYGAGFMTAAGATIFLAYKFLCIAITFMTSFIAYGSMRQVMEERPSMLFAFIYLLNPYRMNDIFIRAAIGEVLAMIFLPPVIVGMWLVMCSEQKSVRQKGCWNLVLGFSGLLSSHIVVSVLAAVFCALFLILLMLLHPVSFFRRISRLLTVMKAAVITALLNAWFLIPFLQFLGWDFGISATSDVAGSGVPVWEFFSAEYFKESSLIIRDVSYNIGTAALLGIVLFSGMILWRHLRNSEATDLMSEPYGKADNGRKHTGLGGRILTDSEQFSGVILLLLTGIALFLASDLFPWERVTELSTVFAATLGKIQYAWRLLTIAAVLVSLILTITMCALYRCHSITAKGISLLLIGMILATAVQTGTEYLQVSWSGRFSNTLAIYTDYTIASADYETNHSWLASGNGPAALDDEAGDITITDYRSKGTNYIFSYVNPTGEDAVVTVPVFWYGLHTAYLIEESASVSFDETTYDVSSAQILESGMNDNLQMTDIVIPGEVEEGTIYLKLETPVLYKAAVWISLCTLIVCLLYGLSVSMKRHFRKTEDSGDKASAAQ